MTWNASLASRIFCTFVAITCCSSCGVGTLVIHPRLDHVDLSDSTSDEVATIRGYAINLLIGAGYCWIESPDDAKRVTVNAGPVDIEVGCGASEMQRLEANLQFEALAGHEYLIRNKYCQGCFQLINVTTDEVIVEAPYCVGKGCLLDLSTGYDKALVKANGGRQPHHNQPKNWWCKPAAEQAFHDVASFLYVDPGPITIDTICWGPGVGKERKKATGFNFIAESGHIYAFSAKKKECVQLLDVTSEETVIACEPYELID